MKIHYPTAIPFCLKCIYLPVYGDSCRLKGSTKWAGGSWPWPSGEKAQRTEGLLPNIPPKSMMRRSVAIPNFKRESLGDL